MKKKIFDCVEFMHQAAERIYAETKGMTQEEELVYWRQKEKEISTRPPRKRKATSSAKSTVLHSSR
jgi:hypothetical protein